MFSTDLRRPALILAALLAGSTAWALDFRDHLGLQLWSLREQTKVSTTGALDLAAGFGFTEVETVGTGSLSPVVFAKALRDRHLTVIGAHFGYPALKADIGKAIDDAKTVGAKWLICSSLSHAKPFTVEVARAAAAELNGWGEACRAAGLHFAYHPHGFEFVPTGNGSETSFDVLMRETKPSLVSFEMDVFWVFHAGQDPVKLLKKYPGRWRFLHLKDIRRGAVTGLVTAKAPPTDKVAVGDGLIDWPAVLAAAKSVGVTDYFIEDEGVQPLKDIPRSLRYLATLKH